MIAAIGILAAIVLVAINPNRQIEAARQAKRRSDINTITKAIQQYSIDNNGQYPAGIETGAKPICQTGNTPTGCIDLSSTLVPTYLASIPEADSNRYYVRRNTSGTSIEVTHPRDDIWNIGGVPSLDLNFTKNKSLIDSVSGNNLINFTRNSPATYVGEDGLIKTAAVNEPRFDHDPVTGESLGLLVEEQRTNLFTNSDIEGNIGSDPIGASIPYKANGQSMTVSNDVFIGPNRLSAKHIKGNQGDSNIGYYGYNHDAGSLNKTHIVSLYVYIPSSQASGFFSNTISISPEGAGVTNVVIGYADHTITDRWQRISASYIPTSANFVGLVFRVNTSAGIYIQMLGN